MKKTGIILPLIIYSVLILTACNGSTEKNKDKSHVNTYEVKENIPEGNENVGTVADYKDLKLELLDCEVYSSEDGRTLVDVHVKFTNNNDEFLCAYESLSVRAFQNNAELGDMTFIENEKSKDLGKKINKGQSVESCYTFDVSGEGDIQVYVYAPGSGDEILARNTYIF